MSEPSATEASNTFWLDFKKEKQSIEDSIEQSRRLPVTQLSDHFSKVLQQINQLDKQITKATTYIPSYDERQYGLQIRELSNLLDTTRAQLTPKPKFSFKSKSKKTKSTSSQKQEPILTTAAAAMTDLLENTISVKNLDNQVVTLEDEVNQWVMSASAAASAAAVDISLFNLTKCVIWLPTNKVNVSTVHIKQLRDCVIVCGTVQGSILIYGLKDSVMIVACHQFRMHDAINVDVLLQVSSQPIMEDSDEIRVGAHDQKSAVNYFDQMNDFNWLRQQASPHWKIMDKDRRDYLSESAHSLIGLEQLSLLPSAR